MTNTESALFDTFNARNLSFEQVATTFVPNKQFEGLIDNNHTLLMGPRGSGKTTLLKMLTPMALERWKTKESKSIKEKIPFFGVYIPTDSQFKRQLEYLKNKLDERNFKIYSRTIVTTNILVSLSKTFYFLTNGLDINKEVELSTALIDAWKLPRPMAPTLHSIEQALLLRVNEINSSINKILYNPELLKSSLIYPEYYYDDFLPLCDYACLSFENIFTEFNQPKWALCFDELELAPKWLQSVLLEYLRSTSQRFLFKLTTSPVISSTDVFAEGVYGFEATFSNDYKIVRTWPVNNNETRRWNKFCEKLVSSRIERRFKSRIDPLEILGTDSLERSTSLKNIILKNEDEYGRNSLTWRLIKEYADVDTSLMNFLIRKGINPYDPVPSSVAQRDTIFRKMKQVLIFRYSFTFPNKVRSRKNVALFYGLPYIYEICDGNPRQLIGLLDELLSRVSMNDRNVLNPLPINVQSEIITNASTRYLKLLASHPEANTQLANKSMNAAELLAKIGNYFHEKLIQDSFTIDPAGSFIVDNVDKQIIILVEFALTYGALVYVNPNEGVSNKGIIGKRFRLSYLLSPVFKLPKRDYAPVNLSSILSHKSRLDNTQLRIF